MKHPECLGKEIITVWAVTVAYLSWSHGGSNPAWERCKPHVLAKTGEEAMNAALVKFEEREKASIEGLIPIMSVDIIAKKAEQ